MQSCGLEQVVSARPFPVYNADLMGLCKGGSRMCENGQGILERAGRQKGSMFEEAYFIPGKEAGAE